MIHDQRWFRSLRMHPAAMLSAVMLTMACHSAWATETLRFGALESLGYPYTIFDADREMSGGLLKDLGDTMAGQLDASPRFVTLSRRRVEPGLASGDVDVVCYMNPKWTDNPESVNWTVATLPQIERVVVRHGSPMLEAIPKDFAGKRVAVQLGYHYPSIQGLFDNGSATRIDETKVTLLFKALDAGIVDALVTSEGEIEGYFAAQPQQRGRFVVSKSVFSREETRCAVSKKSRWTAERVNKAIESMIKRGDIERMAQRYGLSAK